MRASAASDMVCLSRNKQKTMGSLMLAMNILATYFNTTTIQQFSTWQFTPKKIGKKNFVIDYNERKTYTYSVYQIPAECYVSSQMWNKNEKLQEKIQEGLPMSVKGFLAFCKKQIRQM